MDLPGSTMMLRHTVWSAGSESWAGKPQAFELPSLVDPETLSDSSSSDAGVVSDSDSSSLREDDFDGGVLAVRPGPDHPVKTRRKLNSLEAWSPDSPECAAAMQSAIAAFNMGRQPAWRFVGGEPPDLDFSPTLPGAGRAFTLALRQLNAACPAFDVVHGQVVFSDFWTEHTVDHGNVVGRRAFLVLHGCATRRFPEAHLTRILDGMKSRTPQPQAPALGSVTV